MSYVSPVYCTDEDIAVRCVGDFAQLCPRWQRLAAGTDGVIAMDGLWTLTSATANLFAAGLASGHVMRMVKPVANFGAAGELFVVDSVDTIAGSATLRRVGMATGYGQAPAPAAGLVAIQFEVPTFKAQIEDASFQINQEYQLWEEPPGRAPMDLHDLRDLRTLCVLTVLCQMYGAQTRQPDDDWENKRKIICDSLSELKSRLTLRWQVDVDAGVPTPFATRRVYR